MSDKFKLILDHRVDPVVRGSEGYTFLHHLAWAHDQVSDKERLFILATMLVDAGASLTIRDSLLKSTALG